MTAAPVAVFVGGRAVAGGFVVAGAAAVLATVAGGFVVAGAAAVLETVVGGLLVGGAPVAGGAELVALD